MIRRICPNEKPEMTLVNPRPVCYLPITFGRSKNEVLLGTVQLYLLICEALGHTSRWMVQLHISTMLCYFSVLYMYRFETETHVQ